MRGSLQSQIARDILQLGQQEQWAAGTAVPVQSLARRLGVSRTPVRKALMMLAAEGIVGREGAAGFKLLRLDRSGSAALLSADPSRAGSDEDDLSARILADRAGGAIPPDISENDLLTRYGTTRGRVRKALQLLAGEGLVHRQRGHGWRFVESLDNEAAIAESYAFRVSVECAALAQPGYRPDARELARLRIAHLDFLAEASPSRQDWFRINARFHEALAAWSRNRFFLQAVRQQNSLRRMHQFADFPTLSPGEVERSCREHIAILEAVARGDLKGAATELRQHLSAAAPAGDRSAAPDRASWRHHRGA